MTTTRPHRTAAALGLTALLLAGCASTAPPSPTEGDRQAIARATNEALEHDRTGESRNWANEASGHNGTVTPLATREREGREPCRDFQQTFTGGDMTQIAYGTACRTGPEDWRIQRHSGFFIPDRRQGYGRYPAAYYDPWWGYHDPLWGPSPYLYGWGGPRSGVSLGIGTRF